MKSILKKLESIRIVKNNKLPLRILNILFFSTLTVILALFFTCKSAKKKTSNASGSTLQPADKNMPKYSNIDYFYEDYKKGKGNSKRKPGWSYKKPVGTSKTGKDSDNKSNKNSDSSNNKNSNNKNSKNKNYVDNTNKVFYKKKSSKSSDSKQLKNQVTRIDKSKLKSVGMMTDQDLKELYDKMKTVVIINKKFSSKESKDYESNEDKRLYKSYQFSIKKGSRLSSFHTINGPGKDYSLQQSPVADSNHYYFITDRIQPLFVDNLNVSGRPLYTIKSEIDESTYDEIVKKIKAIEHKALKKHSRFMEIVVCNVIPNKQKSREIFYKPRFLNLNKLVRGDKLGFTLFNNQEKNQVEIYFSAMGNIHKAVSKDGVNFTLDKKLKNINSRDIDRDPSITPDGKILVFASTRGIESSVGATQLFISFRKSINDKFEKPHLVGGTVNRFGELFPTIFKSSYGTFIFFKQYNYNKIKRGYVYTYYSIQIKDKVLLPKVIFSAKSQTPFKYTTISFSKKRGFRIFSSYPVNTYDIFRMHVKKVLKVKIDSDGAIIK